jgi:hypothetical protein
MRIYDPRLGKFLSVDPLTRDYPWNSTYAFAENSPIANIDLDGLEKYYYVLVKTNNKPILKLISKIETREFAGIKYKPEESYTVFYGDKSFSFGDGVGLNTSPFGYDSYKEAFDAFVSNSDDKKWYTDDDVENIRSDIRKGLSVVGLLSDLIKPKSTSKIDLKDNPYAKQTDSQLQSSKKSYQDLIKEHQQKLKDYKSDPDKYDNKGLLKDKSPEIRNKIIDGRIKELNSQIKKQEGELKKIDDVIKTRGL